jgi:DNA-binding beta-propeller fold protein YncE
MGIVVSPWTGDLLVANGSAGNIARIGKADAAGSNVTPQWLRDPAAGNPVAIAVAPDGKIVVANEGGTNAISVFAPDCAFLRGISTDLLPHPSAIAICQKTGDAFVTNFASPSSNGGVVRIPAERLGGKPTSALDPIVDDAFDAPMGVAVSPLTQDVFVANGGYTIRKNAGVCRIPASRAAGGQGTVQWITDSGKFKLPQKLAVARTGDVLVTNTFTASPGFVTRIPVKRFSDNTVALDLISSPLLANPNSGAMHIAISPMTGKAYVSNRAENTIVWIPYSRVTGGSGTPQVLDDIPGLNVPFCVAISPITGALYVGNESSGELICFEIPIEVIGDGDSNV